MRTYLLILALVVALIPLRADVTGKVTLIGQPNSKDETFIAKSFGCGESSVRHTENWKVGPKGELGDVVIWIVDPKSSATPTKIAPTAVIEVKQIGCRYDPHVNAVQAGVPFKIINGDPTLHNVRAKACDNPRQPPGADVFNFGQTFQGQSDQRQFDKPGIFILRCDVHSWMQCWFRVIPNAYFAVSGTDGTFKLPPISGYLDDGDYKIIAWHPRFTQTQEKTVHVVKGVGEVDFQFDGTDSF